MDYDMLKENAKKALGNNYWLAVAVTFLVAIISGAVNSVGIIPEYFARILETAVFEFGELNIGSFVVMLFLWLLSLSISICIAVFCNNVLEVGQCAFYLKLRKGISDFTSIFFPFQNGMYMKVVKVMLKKYIYVFLWSLLFWIPGIIKSFEYFMVDYLAAENPDIDPDRALDISSKTMDGHKMDLFVLELTFIGWWCLVLLTCGIGSYFLLPYIRATKTEFYEFMKAKALNESIATPEEFGIIPASEAI